MHSFLPAWSASRDSSFPLWGDTEEIFHPSYVGRVDLKWSRCYCFGAEERVGWLNLVQQAAPSESWNPVISQTFDQCHKVERWIGHWFHCSLGSALSKNTILVTITDSIRCAHVPRFPTRASPGDCWRDPVATRPQLDGPPPLAAGGSYGTPIHLPAICYLMRTWAWPYLLGSSYYVVGTLVHPLWGSLIYCVMNTLDLPPGGQ